MSDPLSRLLDGRPWLLADGGVATTLFARGLALDAAPELWNTEHPDEVRDVHSGFIAAGSDVVLTNTFGGNAARLSQTGAGRVEEVNRAGAELAFEAAARTERPVLVAGSVGPTGAILEPMGTLPVAGAVDMFHEQAEVLRACGAEILWVETMSSAEEYRAAAEAARRADMPWCGTMSFDTAGRTMMGLAPQDLAELVDGLPHPPVAFGANCGHGASDLLRAVLGLAAQGHERPLIAKGNAGLPRLDDGRLSYDGTPELMADYAVLARDCGARVIGGCCGTTPAHLERMRAALVETPPAPRPTLDVVVRRLGRFSAGPGHDGRQRS